MKELDTIREALEVMRTGKIMVPCSLYIDGSHTMVPKVANNRECTELAIKALAALSTIDPDAIRLECANRIKDLKKSCTTKYPSGYEMGVSDGYDNAIAAILGKEAEK